MKNRDEALPDLANFPTLPTIPGISPNIQALGLVFIGWLFTLVAAKYGLSPTALSSYVLNGDAKVDSVVTEAVSNYDKYHSLIIGAILVVINGGNLMAASKVVTSSARVVEAQSRAIEAHSRAIVADRELRMRSLDSASSIMVPQLHGYATSGYAQTIPTSYEPADVSGQTFVNKASDMNNPVQAESEVVPAPTQAQV